MTEFQTQTVRTAINALQEDGPPDFCWFGSSVPQEALQTALKKFADLARNEDILLFVPSQDSGKSGFLFTEKAVYFGETMGIAPRRFAYEDITSLSSDRRYLRIAASDTKVEWNLTETLLWERSRKKVASVVVPLLQRILDPATQHRTATETGSSRSGSSNTPPPAKPKVEIESVEPVDWPSVLAFQLPIALLGIPFVMPLIIAILGKLGGAGSAFDLNYGEMLMIGATGLIPLMYAYGTDLRFSFGRFLAAVALLIFITVQVLASGGGVAPISFGGGLIGVAVAAGLGHGGLAVYRQVGKPEGRRVAIWAVAVVAVVVGGLIINEYFEDRERHAAWEAENQRRQQWMEDFWGNMRAAIAATNPDIPTTGNCFKGGVAGDSCRFNNGVQLRLTAGDDRSGPCVYLTTGNTFKDDRFFENLYRNKAEIENSLGYALRWSRPTARTAPSGARVGSYGGLAVCLDSGSYYDRTDWARQHTWMALRLSDFYSIVVRYHEDFDQLTWQETDP